MAEPILLDRFRDISYSQNQLINDKLDLLIGEVREMKKDIREVNSRVDKLDEKIDGTREELKGDINKLDTKIGEVEKKLDAKIDQTHAELKGDITEIKQEIRTTRWQAFGVVVAQICSIGAIVWGIVSALK